MRPLRRSLDSFQPSGLEFPGIFGKIWSLFWRNTFENDSTVASMKIILISVSDLHQMFLLPIQILEATNSIWSIVIENKYFCLLMTYSYFTASSGTIFGMYNFAAMKIIFVSLEVQKCCVALTKMTKHHGCNISVDLVCNLLALVGLIFSVDNFL